MAPTNFGFLSPAVRLAALEAQRDWHAPQPNFMPRPRPTFIGKMVTRLFTKRS
jgi:hypothetical protein